MKSEKHVQPGRYETEKKAVRKRCAHFGMTLDDLALATRANPATIRHANKGGPSLQNTLQRIADALGDTDWRYFLCSKTHADIKQGAFEFIEAVEHGEEFDGLRDIGISLMINKSFAHPRVAKVARKLKRLCKKTGQKPSVAYHALWQHYIVRGSYDVALGVAITMSRIASTSTSTAHAKRALGECLFYLGKFQRALKHLTHKSVSDFEEDDAWEEPLALDTKVSAYGHASIAQCIIGNVTTASTTSQEAISRAKELKHAPSLVFALHCAAVREVILGSPGQAETYSNQVLREVESAPFPLFEALARLVSCWARVKLNREVSKSDLFSSFADTRIVHNRIARPLWLGLTADCLLNWKDYEFAAHLLDDAIEMKMDHRDALYIAEIWRLKGLASLATNPKKNPTGLKYLKRSIKIAKSQKAWLYSLRSANALYRFASQKPDRAYARKWIEESVRKIHGVTADTDEGKKILKTRNRT